LIRKVSMEDSKSNNLIQLADMLCGAVSRSLGGGPKASQFRDLIRKKEKRLQIWPKAGEEI